MQADIITIGDEILIGQIVNTNATYLSEMLTKAGYKIGRITAIADQSDEIVRILDERITINNLIILTGGLGPTKDDRTKHTLCAYFKGSLQRNPSVLAHIANRLKTLDVELSELNKQQADVPDNCTVLFNQYGTAPGMLFRAGNCLIASLPGVPYEMKGIFEQELFPLLMQEHQLPHRKQKTFHTSGIAESALSEVLTDFEDNLPDCLSLAYLPSPGNLRLRLSGFHPDATYFDEIFQQQEQKLLRLIEKWHFGSEDETLAQVVGHLLLEKGQTLSTAESCTGGSIARLITSEPGASAYFKGAVVAYDNTVKEHILDVPSGVLIKHGAVSRQVVEAMALGVQKKLLTTYSIATSGIAGPGGGSDDKPVGTVCIAIAGPQKLVSKQFQFGQHRERNIQRASMAALNMLRLLIRKDNEL